VAAPTPPPPPEPPEVLRRPDLPLEERLRRYVARRLRDLGAGDTTDDLAAEVMAKYARHRPTVYKPWLERTLRSTLIDHWRRGRIRLAGEWTSVRFERLPPSSFVSDPAGGPPAGFPSGLLASSLSSVPGNEDVARRMLAALTPRQREVVVARYWEDLSSAAIAGLLGYKNAAVVDTVLDRAERRLRERFGGGIDAVH
jgi:DNA-directed RNA polymerase specialized sigma24 family protein